METASRLVFVFLLNGLWQIPLVAAAAWLAARLLRNGPASYRHAIWIAALLAALALPLASLRTTAPATRRIAIAYEPAATSAPITARPSSSTAPRPAAPKPLTLDYAPFAATALLALYLGLTLFRAARLAWAWGSATRLRAHAQSRPLPPPVAAAFRDATAALRAPGTQLLWSADVASPLMTGVFRKSVILPDSLLAESSGDVLLTALGHELGHAARNDFAWNLFYELLALPIACHPAVVFILARIRETRELACDELVTRRLLAPHRYARSLVAVAAQMHAAIEAGCALGVFDGNILEERVRRLLAAPTRLRHARLWLAAALSAVALCAVLVSGLAVSAQAQNAAITALADIPGLRTAVTQDPNNLALRLQLAQSLAAASRPDDARDQFLQVIGRDPANQPALEGIMLAAVAARRNADARLWANQLLKVNPNQTTALYIIGYTAWTTAYPDLARARQAAGMPGPDQGILPDPTARQAFRAKYAAQIDEGLKSLRSAVQIDPDYSDAMAYLNLLLRMKSAVTETESEHAALLAEADAWVGQALAAKKRAATQATPASAARSTAMVVAPPPPPPPPPPSYVGNALVSSTPAPPHHGPDRAGTYWQVTAATPIGVQDLIRNLKIASFPTMQTVTNQDGDLHVYVMAGPYQDSQLDQAKSALEAAGYRVIEKW